MWRDNLTTRQINAALIAHIIADSPDGPRGDEIRSPLLAKDVSNLMLLCHAHHRSLDHEHVAEHPEDVLLRMKSEHEARIALVTGFGPELRSELVILRTPIGVERPTAELTAMRDAVFAAGRYPAEEITLDLTQNPVTETSSDFWSRTRSDLQDFYAQRVHWRLAKSSPHLSIFALAPIPILIAFGKLLGDKVDAIVFQRFRTPAGWRWMNDQAPLHFALQMERATGPVHDVVVVVSISDTVQTPDLITLPVNAPIYRLGVGEPRRDCVRRSDDVAAFVVAWQSMLNRIREWHSADAPCIHLVAAVPNSLAIEMGRTVPAKAHSRIAIYDMNRNLGGLRFAFDL